MFEALCVREPKTLSRFDFLSEYYDRHLEFFTLNRLAVALCNCIEDLPFGKVKLKLEDT